MDNVKMFFEDLKSKNIQLWRTGEKLNWKAPKGALSKVLRCRMKKHKRELLELVDVQELINTLDGNGNISLVQANCLSTLEKIPENIFDLIVTDPPYGYKFMGKDWDKAVPSVQIWKECLRVLKPGGFAFITSGPRQDALARMIVNLEEAGFIIGFTSLYWTYASGFPKAHNISKAINKKEGYEHQIVGYKKGVGGENLNDIVRGKKVRNTTKSVAKGGAYGCGAKQKSIDIPVREHCEKAKKFEGSYGGFQPKPAVEVIIVVQKPPTEKTQVGQALDNGKGVTCLDGCRVPYTDDKDLNGSKVGFGKHNDGSEIYVLDHKNIQQDGMDRQGRFPANLLVSDDILDSHSRFFSLDAWADLHVDDLEEVVQKNLPFLIVPKASKKEKEFGCDNLIPQQVDKSRKDSEAIGCNNPRNRGGKQRKNHHPTVKPILLMSYLITMGSRKGDLVLDPFCGSGTTCLAAHRLRRRSIGIEVNKEYFDIAKARVNELLMKSHRISEKGSTEKKTGVVDTTESEHKETKSD